MLKKYFCFLFVVLFIVLNFTNCKKNSKEKKIESNSNELVSKLSFNFSLFNSSHSQSKHSLNLILKTFIGKNPNFLYENLGKPDIYNTILKKNKIKNAQLIYKYIYNFAKQNYDCEIVFTTNKEQNKITHVDVLSEMCYIITLY